MGELGYLWLCTHTHTHTNMHKYIHTYVKDSKDSPPFLSLVLPSGTISLSLCDMLKLCLKISAEDSPFFYLVLLLM